MPRNVRNWWIEAEIDGRTARIGAGPQSQNGGIFLRVLQRQQGGIIEALRAVGEVQADGRLCLWITVQQDPDPLTVTTER